MHLCTDTVNDPAICILALDKSNHSLNLGIIGVEVIVVYVQLGIRICTACGLEGDGNEGLYTSLESLYEPEEGQGHTSPRTLEKTD